MTKRPESRPPPVAAARLGDHPRGSALVVALVFVVLALASMMAIIEFSSTNARSADRFETREALFYAANGALDTVINDIWGDYLHYSEGGDPNFRQYIIDAGKGQYGWPTLLDGQRIEVAHWTGLRFGQGRVTRVRISRDDEDLVAGHVFNTNLHIELEVTSDRGDQMWVSRTLSTTNKDNYKGFDYAVLTNNISCSMCHMKVQNLDKAHNLDAGMYGKFERVKVGTLDMLALRADGGGDYWGGPSTLIEGTLFQRGLLESERDGQAIDLNVVTASSLDTSEYNTNQTTVKQVDASGNLNAGPYSQQTDMTNQGINPNTNLPYPKEHVYLDYPRDAVDMERIDGDLPTEFPAPFKDYYDPGGSPEVTQNRKVDPQEVASMMTDDQSEGDLGQLSADISVTVPDGTMWNAAQMPNVSNGATISIDQSGNPNPYYGNVVMVGTPANPIRINGKVVIEGDLVINGVVEGEGQIWATGNVYVPGDLQYNDAVDGDGNEIYGRAPDGSNNLLGLVAGGNIVVGDYLSTVTHWNSGKSAFYEYGQPERGQRVTSSDPPFNPNDPRPYARAYTGLNGGNDVGTTTESTVGYDVNGDGDTNDTVGKVNFANFVVEELAIFNRMDLTRVMEKVPTGSAQNKHWKGNDYITSAGNYNTDNPVYTEFNDPSNGKYYTPRFYQLYPSTGMDWGNQNYLKNSPPPVYLNDKNKFLTSKNGWNATGDPHTYNAMRTIDQIPWKNSTSMSKAVVKSIHPEWITPGNMLALIMDEESKRVDNTPRRLDGLLYTNNAIFAIERKKAQQPKNGTYWDVATQTWQRSGGGTPEFERVNSRSRGRMVVNGAMIAPDLGILVTGGTTTRSTPEKYYAPVRRKDGSVVYEIRGFNVNYDARVRYLLDVYNSTQVIWSRRRKGWSRNDGPMPE